MRFSVNILPFYLLCSALFFSQGLGLERVLANTATPQTLLLHAQEAAQANKVEIAIMLGQQAAQLAQEQGNKAFEARIRGDLVDYIRGLGISNYMALYRKQLERLETLHPIEEPPITEPKVLLYLLRTELFGKLNQLNAVISYAQKAQVGAEKLRNPELLRTAQLLEGVALSQKVFLGEVTLDSFLGFLPGKKQTSLIEFKRPKELLTSALQGSIHTAFKYLEFPGYDILFSIAVQEGQLDLAQQILDRFPESPSGAPAAQAKRLYDLAILKLLANQWEEGRELVKQANLFVKTENNGNLKSETYLAASIPYSLLVGQYEEAKEFFSWTIMFLQGTPEGVQLIIKYLHGQIIPALENRNLSQLGTEFLEQVLAIPVISDSPEMSYKIYPALGRFYAKLMDSKRLVNLLDRFLKQTTSHPNWEVSQSLALSFGEILKTKDANLTKSFYRKAIEDSWGVRSSFPEAGSYFLHAIRKAMHLALEIGNYQDAVDFAILGLTSLSYEWLEESEVEKEAALWFLVDAGEVLTKIGRVDLAIHAIKIAIGEQSHAPPGWASRIALSSAKLFALLGDYENAKAYLDTGLKNPFQGRGVEDKAAEYWLQLANIQYQLGDYFRAEKSLQACIDSATKLVIQPIIEGECRAHLGYFWTTMTNGEEGWKEWINGMKLLAPNLFKYLEVSALSNQGIVSESKNDQESIDISLEFAQISLDFLALMTSTVWTQTRRALFLSQMALLKKFRGDEPPYLELTLLESILEALIREPYISQQDFVALTFTARNLRDTGNPSLAIPLMENITQRLEYVRSVTPDPRAQIYFGAGIDQDFDLLADLHLQNSQAERSKRVREALVISDANRGRAVSELFNISEPVVPMSDMDPSAKEFIRTQLEKNLSGVRLGKQIRPLVEIRDDWKNFLTKLTIDNDLVHSTHKLSDQPQQRPIPRVDIEAVQRQLDPTTVIIVYHFTDELAGAWVVTNEQLDWVPLEGWNTIQEAILRFRTELLSNELSWKSRISSAGKQAYSTLLAPLLQLVPQATHLVLIPDRSAFVIPFEAMVFPDGPNEGRYLIEKFDISYQFSLELLRRLGESKTFPRPPPNSILLMGNPDFEEVNHSMATKLMPLPGTQHEMEMIRQVVGAKIVHLYTGAQATRDQLTQAVGEAGIVHVATHGVMNAQRPWESFLAFAGSTGKLALPEISALKTSADLVVLSACDTGRGKVLEGEGVWGFQAQFLAAGAKNVVASLWRVADESTAQFMANFYRALSTTSNSYAASLRQAKLELMANEQWRHPYYWGPFILYGSS